MTQQETIHVFRPSYAYTPHPSQMLVHGSDARFRIAVMGRKWGKTELAQNEVMNYMGVPESVGWWVAPVYATADIAWKRLLNNLHPGIIKRKSQRDRTIQFINDSVLGFKSTENEKSLLGEGLDVVVLEEASRIKESIWFETIRPNLGDSSRTGDMLALTTPNGLDWVYREWLKGLDERFLDYEAWAYHFDTLPIINEKVDPYDGGFPSWLNPYWRDLDSVINHPRKIVLQEYAARFIEDLSNIFIGINNILNSDMGLENKPDPNKNYYAGFDVARSGAGDNAVVEIVDENYVLCHELVMRGKPLPYQVKIVKEVCEEWNQCPVLVDTTNPMGDSVYEFIEESYPKAQPYHYTAQNKRELMDNLSILIQTGQVTIPTKNDETRELLQELRVFGAERTRSGEVKYTAPQGFLDDRVNAYALAVWLANKSKAQSKTWAKFITI